MSDVKRYVQDRAKRDPEFAENYDVGYADFKIGVVLRQAREAAGLTQDEVARKLKTKKSAISRIENHADDVSGYPPFADMRKPLVRIFRSDYPVLREDK
jgi:DNA-binding XRE family transcriptional regulator